MYVKDGSVTAMRAPICASETVTRSVLSIELTSRSANPAPLSTLTSSHIEFERIVESTSDLHSDGPRESTHKLCNGKLGFFKKLKFLPARTCALDFQLAEALSQVELKLFDYGFENGFCA